MLKGTSFSFIIIIYACTILTITPTIFQLDERNFDSVTNFSRDWLIRFYAPRCAPCRSMLAAFEEAIEQLADEVNVGEIDVSQNRKLLLRFNITECPTVKLLHEGKHYTFQGSRISEEYIEFVRGGYLIHSPEYLLPPLGYFGEAILLYKHACEHSFSDLRAGKLFSRNVFLAYLPSVCGLLFLIALCIPMPKMKEYDIKQAKEKVS